MYTLPISTPRFKSIIFYQNIPKIKIFLQKIANFSSAGGSASRPPNTASPLRIPGYAPASRSHEIATEYHIAWPRRCLPYATF